MKLKSNFLIGVSIIASFLLPGLGHFFLGFWKRGLLWLFGVIALGILVSYFFPMLTATFAEFKGLQFSIFGVMAAILCATDVWWKAKLYNIELLEKARD